MKSNIIYILIVCFGFTFFACEDNIEDATSKHVYGENENPYLKVDIDATVVKDMKFEVGRFEPQILNLEDYTEKFRQELNMSVDQLINGLKNGGVVFYNINVSRGRWDKTEMTKGSTGWYYNSAGGVIDDSEGYVASLEINMDSKQLIVNVNENVEPGTTITLNVGFALNGPDYDDYLRFTFNVSVTDPSLIIINVAIPEGDYAASGIYFYDYAEVIQYNMGITVDEFLANLDNNEEGTIRMYVIDNVTGEWDTSSSYTANPPGYWMNADGKVCSWGDEGFTLFAEVNTSEGVLNIGRAPGLSAGKTYKINLGFRDSTNEMSFIRLIITATLE